MFRILLFSLKGMDYPNCTFLSFTNDISCRRKVDPNQFVTPALGILEFVFWGVHRSTNVFALLLPTSDGSNNLEILFPSSPITPWKKKLSEIPLYCNSLVNPK